MILGEVNIGGELRQYIFSMNQRIRYCQLRSMSVVEMNKELSSPSEWDESVVRDLVYSALWAGKKSKKEIVDFDEFTVGEWIEEMEDDELSKVFQSLIDAQEVSGDDKKKAKESQ